MFDGTVKTSDELRWIIKGDTPHTIGKNNETWTADKRMTSGDTASIDLVAETQTIKFTKLNKHNLYVIAEDKCYRSNEFKDAMYKMKKSIIGNVQIGNPLTAPEELTKLSNADAAVIVVRLKGTKQKDVQMMNQYCQNFNVPVNDVIVINEA